MPSMGILNMPQVAATTTKHALNVIWEVQKKGVFITLSSVITVVGIVSVTQINTLINLPFNSIFLIIFHYHLCNLNK